LAARTKLFQNLPGAVLSEPCGDFHISGPNPCCSAQKIRGKLTTHRYSVSQAHTAFIVEGDGLPVFTVLAIFYVHPACLWFNHSSALYRSNRLTGWIRRPVYSRKIVLRIAQAKQSQLSTGLRETLVLLFQDGMEVMYGDGGVLW